MAVSIPLPRPAPGAVVLSPSTGARSLGVFLLVVVALFLVLALLTTTWFFVVVLGVVLLVGSLVMRDSLEAMYRWKEPQLILSSASLELGGGTVLHYRRQSRKVVDVSRSHVSCVLTCEESATYTRGTTSHTDTATVFEQRFGAPADGTSWGFEAHVPVEVPIDAGAPTFDLGNNEVQWTIETFVDGSAMPSDSHRFDVEVAPVLAPRSQQGAQDS